MPRNEQGKNKKWSKHRERDTGEARMAELSELAARQGKEVWELNHPHVAGDEEEKAVPGVSTDIVAPPEEEQEEDEEIVSGHQGLMAIENPNRKNPLVVEDADKISRKHKEAVHQQRRQDKEDRLMRDGATAQAKQDLERLADIRAKREAAAREREDKKQQSDKLKAEAASTFKKRS